MKRILSVAAAGLALIAGAEACRRKAAAPAPRELRVGIEADLPSLDPATDSVIAWTVLGNVFEPLTTLDADLRVVPALAARWTTPDDQTWVFELRAGAVFHDGTAVRAADVRDGIERVRRDPQSLARPWLASVEDVAAVSPSSVRVRTRWPDPLLLHHLAQVPIAKGASTKEIDLRPVGTGPYRVVKRSRGLLALEAFARYWGGAPRVPSATFVVTGEGAPTVAALGRGDVDLAALPAGSGSPPPDARFAVIRAPGLSTMFLWMNARPGGASPNPLADSRVRRAIALAIDRPALSRRVIGDPSAAAVQLVPRSIFGFQPDLAVRHVDLAAARRLLAAAGLAAGFPVELMHRDTGPIRRTASDVAAALATIGIRAIDREIDYVSSLLPYREGMPGLFIDAWTFDVADASSFLTDCFRTRDPAAGLGLLNPGYSNPAMDVLIDRSARSLDAPSRRLALRRVLEMAEEEVPALALFGIPQAWGIAKDVVFRPRPDGRILLSEIEPAPNPASAP